MCLAIPGKVVSVEGNKAEVEFGGVVKEVRIDPLEEEVEAGDFILNHAGFAITTVSEEDVLKRKEELDNLESGVE